jgi:hypothetical protein
VFIVARWLRLDGRLRKFYPATANAKCDQTSPLGDALFTLEGIGFLKGSD